MFFLHEIEKAAQYTSQGGPTRKPSNASGPVSRQAQQHD
jgi:hypothetical protein